MFKWVLGCCLQSKVSKIHELKYAMIYPELTFSEIDCIESENLDCFKPVTVCNRVKFGATQIIFERTVHSDWSQTFGYWIIENESVEYFRSLDQYFPYRNSDVDLSSLRSPLWRLQLNSEYLYTSDSCKSLNSFRATVQRFLEQAKWLQCESSVSIYTTYLVSEPFSMTNFLSNEKFPFKLVLTPGNSQIKLKVLINEFSQETESFNFKVQQDDILPIGPLCTIEKTPFF